MVVVGRDLLQGRDGCKDETAVTSSELSAVQVERHDTNSRFPKGDYAKSDRQTRVTYVYRDRAPVLPLQRLLLFDGIVASAEYICIFLSTSASLSVFITQKTSNGEEGSKSYRSIDPDEQIERF